MKRDVRNSNYQIKRIENVVVGADVQARILTLAPGDVIPWHYHKQCADYYFVLEGTLTIATREPTIAQRTFGIGATHTIAPGTAHFLTNRSTADCRFLLLQGVGTPDWIEV